MNRQTKIIDTSPIEWTGATWNPHQGCVKKIIEIEGEIKLREECRNCYMYRDKKRYGQMPQIVTRSKPGTFNKPRRWQKEVEAGKRKGIDRLVFTSSWTDFFNPEADSWRAEEWQIMRECPGLIFQVLTKLIDRVEGHLPPFWDEIKDRVWMGTTAGYQPALDWAAPYLLKIDAGVRFLSCEPLLGDLDLLKSISRPDVWNFLHPDHDYRLAFTLDKCSFDWIIGGGESGPKARPTHPEWARSLRDQCQAADVPFFWKQWGAWYPLSQEEKSECAPLVGSVVHNPKQYTSIDGEQFERLGKKKSGRLLDGVEWSQFPLHRLPEQIADEIRAQQGGLS